MSGPKFLSRTTESFWPRFDKLPVDVQRQAREAFRVWLTDPAHPSLHFKRISGRDPIYSARIGLAHRALGRLREDTVLWFWIGHHDEYERMLGL